PLCTGDSRDICAKPGSTLGFTLDYLTSAGNVELDYPAKPDDFAHFADLEISATPLSADLAVQTTADKKSVVVGETVTVRTTVKNEGPDTAGNGILDTSYKLSGIQAKLPSACGCALPALAAGATQPVVQKITPTSVALGGGTISLNANASASEPDPTQSNNV